MAPPKDIARSYPKRGLTADVGFRSEPKFCGDGSAEFDGATQGAKSATTYSITSSGSKTTIAGWALPRTLTGTNTTLFANVKDNTTDNFGIYRTAANEIAVMADYGSLRELASAKNLDPNRWYFLAATFDFDTTTLKFYVDGIERSDTPAIGTGGTTGFFEIGYRDNGGSPIQNFDGLLAHVMMIEDVLTQSEIVELMRDTTYAKAQTFGTVNRYYVLDADFNDSTGSHNATSVGSPSFTVTRPQLPRGLDLARGAAMARVYTGRAVDFDGSADKIIAAHYNPSGDFLTTTAWVNADTLRGQGLIYNGSTGRNSFLFYMLSTGVLNFYWNDTTGDARITHQTPLKNGQWYHLAAVMDMSDPADHQVTFYIDGIAATGTRTASGFTGDNNYGIGLEYASTGWFDGKIADCRIFDVELTQDQIRELYHNPEQVLPTGVSASNLRRYYPLSDYNDTGGTGGRYFQDMGADGEPAEDKGSATMAFAQPVPCPQLGLQQSATRLLFPGGGTTHNAVATTAALGTTASVSCWFQANNISSTQIIWSIGNTAGTGFLEAFIMGNAIYIFGQSNITVVGATEGAWTHLVVTTDSGSPPYKAYVNGAEISLSGSDTARNLTNGTFEIGNQDTAFSPYVFNGILNDVACWNTELSSSDVSALYNSGVMGMDVSTVQSSNLKGWWKCDDLTTLKDYSGNGANATVTNTFNAASFPENASGSTIVGDFSMKRKGVSILNLTGSDDGTAIIPAQEAVYPKAGASNGYTIGFCYRKIKDGTAMVWGNTGASTNDQFMCFQQAGPNLRFNLGDGSSRPAVNTSNITDSDWHHYTLTISYATTPAEVKIYVDGAVDHSSTQSITGPPALHPMHLGTGLFDGQGPVGCFKFYQVALSADEVKRLAFSDLRLIKGLENE
jgi:hypothetical protein